MGHTKKWWVVLGGAIVATTVLGGCDEDDDWNFGQVTDVVGRMVLPDGSPAAGATCEIFVDNLSFGAVLAASDGVFEFDEWPEEYEPFLVRGRYVQPVTGAIFIGASPLFFTESSGDTNIGTIVLSQVTTAPRLAQVGEAMAASAARGDAGVSARAWGEAPGREAEAPDGGLPEALRLAVVDANDDGVLDLMVLDPKSGTPVSITLGR